MVRTAARPQGLEALTIREVIQLTLANSLLLFAVRAFFAMVVCGRFAMIEHPASPEDISERWLATIWRLYIVEVLQKHPWVQTTTILQGYYGAKNPKPTTLMFSCGNSISVTDLLRKHRATSVLPKALQMGRCGDEYATASLKNYAGGLCRAIALTLERWILTNLESDFVGLTSLIRTISDS